MSVPNLFEKMMKSGAEDTADSQSKSKSVVSFTGRPTHNGWAGLKKEYKQGRISAKCKMCGDSVKNTARERLEKHR